MLKICFPVLSIILLISCSRNTFPIQSSDKNITGFVFKAADNSMLATDITGIVASDTIKVIFVKGTVVSNLVPNITFTGKSISPSNKTAQNFANNINYTVTAQDGSTLTYIFSVSFIANDKNITSFSFRSVDNLSNLSKDVNGIISSDSINLTVPFATKLNNLVPFILITGKSVSPGSLVNQDFTNPVNYAVTGQDGSLKNYVVKVSVELNTISIAGTIFVSGSTDNYSPPDSGNVYALDAATGALKWNFKDNSTMYKSPTVANGLVYECDRNGYIFALDVNTGNVVWKQRTGSTGTYPDNNLSVANGILYQGESLDSTFYALDAGTGNFIWKFISNSGTGSPTVFNGVVYFATNKILALNSTTGSLIWSTSPSTDSIGFGGSNPAIANGILYIGCNDRNVYALDVNSGKTLWSFNTGDVIESSPTVVNGIVYIGSGVGQLFALNASTGSLVWRSANLYPIQGSPIVANGMVYFASNAQYLFALDASTGSMKWSYKLDNTVYSSPLYFSGAIFIGSSQNFYAIDASTGNLIWQFADNGRIFSTPCALDKLGNIYHASISGNQN